MSVFSVRHETTYTYARPVGFGTHKVMFRPRDSQDQRLLQAELRVSPQPANLRWIHDVFGNSITIVDFDTPSSELRFEMNLKVEHSPSLPYMMDEQVSTWPFTYDQDIEPDLRPWRRPHHPGPELESFARQFAQPGTRTGHLLFTMANAISDGFAYSRRTSPGTQVPVQTLHTRSGTCRDFALLMMDACRSLGLAARFVTGYLYVPARDVAERRGGGATHAWVQVFLPGAGWVEFDPTNGIVGSRDLIRVGVAREPAQARPISGSFDGRQSDYLGMNVEVQVTRLPDVDEGARVITPVPRISEGGRTKPH